MKKIPAVMVVNKINNRIQQLKRDMAQIELEARLLKDEDYKEAWSKISNLEKVVIGLEYSLECINLVERNTK